jgi:hypothetical protein
MRKTYSILAVAFTTSACAGVASEAPARSQTNQELVQELAHSPLPDALKRRDYFVSVCDDAPHLGGTVDDFCAAIAPKPQVSEVQPKPTPEAKPEAEPEAPAAACDTRVLDDELAGKRLEEAVAQADHFRCLCDDKGYPLVGNINGKALTTPSAFCAALRAKGLL